MVRLKDPELLAVFQEVLSEWNIGGTIIWLPQPTEWLDANIEGHDTKSAGKLMFEHFHRGGEIDQVRETRLDYTDNSHHYDFRFAINGRRVYIETVLRDSPCGPVIVVVSMHDE
ncbi:MAG: hypothetical protein SGJ20_19125 [Planctomycetota bacterium]|nr:hypothetical protein [Planctomycetota bacterium]